jgi:hypothetical protein
MTMRPRLLAAGLGAGLVLLATGAVADETRPPAEVEITPVPAVAEIQLANQEPEPFTGEAARRDWQNRRVWDYGTRNLYPLTRGMADAGIPAAGRWPLYPFTALFDTGNLVFSAIGGLYGD